MRENTVGRPMEILLVEDSILSARITIGALRAGSVQHRLTWLSNGNEALEFLHQRGLFSRAPQPDLILLDLGLPGCDGRELLRDIRGDERLRNVPVVVLTGSTDEEDQAASEQLQVEKYLIKPVDLDKFMDVVRELNRFWQEDMIVPTV
ncbi:MAG: response regulator [Planctomycetaceae bacterium]|nr:response regulator [Planctomycetaceae bacterium]